MVWNIGDNRIAFLNVRTKLGLNHVPITSSEQDPKKINLAIVEMQQLEEVKKFDSENKISCLRWINFNGRSKICVFCKTDTDYVGTTVYQYRNDMYMKDSDIELKATHYNALLQKKKVTFKLSRNLLQKIYRGGVDNSLQLTVFRWEMEVFLLLLLFNPTRN